MFLDFDVMKYFPKSSFNFYSTPKVFSIFRTLHVSPRGTPLFESVTGECLSEPSGLIYTSACSKHDEWVRNQQESVTTSLLDFVTWTIPVQCKHHTFVSLFYTKQDLI